MKLLALIPALLLSAALPAGAQDALTLDRAIDAALAANASLRASRAMDAENAARVTEARAAFLPRVSLSESWQRGDQPVFVFSSLLAARRFAAVNFAVDALDHPDPIAFFRAGAGVEQVIFDGGRTRSAVTAAVLRHEISGVAIEQRAADLVAEVTQTFGRVLTAQAARRASETGLASAREDLSRAERRRDAGLATDADVLSLGVLVAELRQRGIQADGDAAIARAELNRLMGDAIEREFLAIQPPPSDPSAGDTIAIAALFADAEVHNPELRRAALAERLADADVRAAKGGVLPRVTAQASIDVGGTRFMDRASAWLIGGELRWTLSTGGAELAQRKAATAAALRARAEYEDARAGVHVQVITALRRLETARARQIAGRAAVDQARESQRIIRDRFDAGMAGVGDVLRASTAVLDAEANHTAAMVDVIVGSTMLRRSLGRIR